MTLLFADDDPITLDSLGACARGEGYTVLLARDGREALELWRTHRPRLLCLDIMMPHVDGYEVCRQVRAADPAVPVFVRKPFGKHELLARIRRALHRVETPAPAAPFFHLRDLRVYPRELRAERGNTSVELSARECAILQLLHERAGEVVSRDALLDRCWGAEYFPESRTLDQHIAKLRKRVERDPAAPEIIETVRGVGYRFRPQVTA